MTPNNRALENIEVSLEKGIRRFDTAIGGLGGCPYAPGARGNVATTKVVERLHELGYETGIDVDSLARVVEFVLNLKYSLEKSP